MGRRVAGLGISCRGFAEEAFGSCPAPPPRGLEPHLPSGLDGEAGPEALPSCRMPHRVLPLPFGVMTPLLACWCPLRKNKCDETTARSRGAPHPL